MSAVGNAIGAAIVANKAAAQKAFPIARFSASVFALAMAQAEGNAIADNLPTSQGGATVANWDGGQANTNYGGTVSINAGGV